MIVSSWQIEFARPLWFGVLAALPLWLIVWRRSLVRLSPVRRAFSILLRTLLLLAVAVGLSAPTATGLHEMPIVVAKASPPRPAAPPVALAAPDQVRAGVPFSLDLLIHSASSGTATVEVLRDSQLLGKEIMSLVAGDNHKSLPMMVEKPSRVTYRIKMPDNGLLFDRDATAACAIYVDPPPRVLLVESQPVLAEHLRKALVGENVEVEVKTELPRGAEGLDRYDLIILSNVPADTFTSSQMTALQSYVRAGGGLIAVGGDHAFTVGGYRHTRLEEMLPVISESHTPKPKPKLAMVLMMDVSGSMNNPVSKGAKERNIDLAKEALGRAVEMLGPRDQVGVLVFEDTSRWIWPLSPVVDKEKIIAKINTIEAGGETNMYPPLEQAYLALRESFADVKHIIVATDGIGGPGDFDGLARKIAAAGITMSTVGLGSEPVRPFMQSLADRARGHAYFCDNGKAIPQIFQTDTGVTAKIGITEEPFFPQVVRDAAVLRGLDMAKVPTLLGYVETQARPEAQVVLAAKTGEPIVALWRYGQGRTAAFTSDIQSRWAAPWLNWSGFGRFWVQLVRATMRPDRPPTSRLTAAAADGRLDITLDAEDRDGRYINGAEVKVTAPLPLGERGGEGDKIATVPMSQIAPGRYTASHAARLGTYWLNADIRRNGKPLEKVRGSAVGLSMPEPAARRDGSVETVEQSGLRTVLLWPWLFGLAAVVQVLELAVRRTARPLKVAEKERKET